MSEIPQTSSHGFSCVADPIAGLSHDDLDFDFLLDGEIDNFFGAPSEPGLEEWLQALPESGERIINDGSDHPSLRPVERNQQDSGPNLKSLVQQMQQVLELQQSGGPDSAPVTQQALYQLQNLVHQLQQQINVRGTAPLPALSEPQETFPATHNKTVGGSRVGSVPASHHVQSTVANPHTHPAKVKAVGSKRDSSVMCKRTTERHKKLGKLENLLEEKKALAAKLQLQNSFLQQRQNVLQKFIQAREEHLMTWSRLVGAKKQDVINPGTKHPVVGSLTVAEVCSLDLVSAGVFYTKLVSEVRRLLTVAGGVDSCREGANISTSQPRLQGAYSSDSVLSHDAVQASHSQPLEMSPQDIERTTQQQEVMSREEANKQLEEIVLNMVDIGKYVEFFNPALNTAVLSTISSNSVPPQHWDKVTAACGLKKEQIQETVMLDHLFTQLMARVYEERSPLISKLQDTLFRLHASSMLVSDLKEQADSILLLESIMRNLKKERCYIFLASEVFINHILTVNQRAAVLVTSYPIMPNDLCIIQRIVANHACGFAPEM
ncbi:hypothetical protein CEUSTIGMA_g11816.t1 [Chlamydomonas eustigma]|uniref:Uncharacterized protein n=1 Tax=Chlamydomonas eustigma TaxID=1157962 RepID=A0A250XMT5_9CHLO|nr:hypothetical protein CEUSTIGMA_g11816.t1 [Chlamydomonas eustigma]|eukprot:GAX84394.1 hypothetical protein CEUSTIGMA_g11816.t1 [Chlamydomonas eustigma]